MESRFEGLPFGVVILDRETLDVKYKNSIMDNIIKQHEDISEDELNIIDVPLAIFKIVNTCADDGEERYIPGVEVFPGCFFNITVNTYKDTVQLFLYEIKEPVLNKKQQTLNKRELTTDILESIPYVVYITDKSGEINYLNKTAYQFFESEDSTYIKNAFEFIKYYNIKNEQGNDLKIVEFPPYVTLTEGRKVENKVMKYFNKGKTEYSSISSYPIFERDEVVGATVVCEIITERYLQKLRQEEEKNKYLEVSTELKTKCDIIETLRNREKDHLRHLRDVINNISEGIVVIDKEDRITLCSSSVYEITGLRHIELMDYKNIIRKYDIAVEENKGRNIEWFYNGFYKNRLPIKDLILKITEKSSKNIKYIELNTSPILRTNGELLHTVVTLTDITEKRINQIIAEEQALFVENVVNTLDVPIAVLDYPKCNYKLLNKKYEELVSCIAKREINASMMINKSIYDVFKESTISGNLTKIAESGEAQIFPPLYIKDYQGRDKYYKPKVAPYKDKNGKTTIYIHVVDVTEEINHNIQLEKVNKLKDEFFNIISHELRTPLTMIYGSLQLAYDVYNGEVTPNIDKTLTRIRENSSRLLKLTNNMMDISKADAGLLTLNNVNFDVVMHSENVVNSSLYYAQRKGINIIFDTNEEECSVLIDKEKFERILLNLLSNAIKYTAENKHIYVNLEVEEESFILRVKDEGVGIPADKINSIFDRYSQLNSSLSRRAEGTGLGLAVVKKFVEAMNASIKVISEERKGSEFIVKFKRYSNGKSGCAQYVTLSDNFDDILNIEMSDVY
ncbi:PAS domain-containing sensor histidine kinase [Clostridium sp. BSD9I1]|uniref:PAS domain-containing sensor histidine kinase n=1 Tax=Clostridium sp. BSD9I1 TaxID=2003589 RepID=UPI001FA863A5|nr:PAS domain-containing sensor histidine kinase [Clostridium sp. BSD9I1]